MRSFRQVSVTLWITGAVVASSTIAMGATQVVHMEGQVLASAPQLSTQTTSKDRIDKQLTAVDFLQRFANEHKVAFVIEGDLTATPLVQQLRRDYPNPSNPLEKEVEDVASECDYEAAFRQGVFVWTRRYSKDQDAVPDISLDEAIATASNLKKLVAPFRTVFPAGVAPSTAWFAQQFVQTLSKEQRDRMSKKPVETSGGLPAQSRPIVFPVSELSQQQRGYMWGLALFFYVERRFDSLEPLAVNLNEIKRESPTFSFVDFGSHRFLALSSNPPSSGKQQYMPIGEPNQVKFLGDTFAVIDEGKDAPQSPVEPPVVLTATNKPSSISLNEAISRFCSDTVEVDERIADKQITIIVPQGEYPEALKKELPTSIASAYGLDLSTDEARPKLSLRRSPRSLTDIRQLRDAVLNSFPQPLVNAVRATVKDKIVANIKVPNERFSLDTERKNAMQTMRSRVTKQLRSIVEPKIENSSQHEVLLASLSPHEEHLLSTLLLSIYLPSVGKFTEANIPSYISDFNDLSIACSASSSANSYIHLGEDQYSSRFNLSICKKNNKYIQQLVGVNLFKLE